MSRRAADGYSLCGWNSDGVAALEAWGHDARAALEEGLRAVLTLALIAEPATGDATRAAPIHAEGAGWDDLFADLVMALLEHIESHGAGIHDVMIDGVLRHGTGVFIAWGYATGTLEQESAVAVPDLDFVTVETDERGAVTLRATLRRSESG